jgi:hypothetical protein
VLGFDAGDTLVKSLLLVEVDDFRSFRLLFFCWSGGGFVGSLLGLREDRCLGLGHNMPVDLVLRPFLQG